MSETRFNYFTEIEDHFRAARGTELFRLSPLDWALIEKWKNGGMPLQAVLRGIDVTFQKWRSRPVRTRTQTINSVSYCAQAVAAEAQAIANAAPAVRTEANPSFTLENVRAFVDSNAVALQTAGHGDLAASLAEVDLDALYSDLEQLEQKLTAIEDEMIARLRATASEEALSEVRRALDRELKPYRGRMTAEQLTMLEKQFVERKLLDSSGLPRLTLFYL